MCEKDMQENIGLEDKSMHVQISLKLTLVTNSIYIFTSNVRGPSSSRELSGTNPELWLGQW